MMISVAVYCIIVVMFFIDAVARAALVFGVAYSFFVDAVVRVALVFGITEIDAFGRGPPALGCLRRHAAGHPLSFYCLERPASYSSAFVPPSRRLPGQNI